MVANLRHDSSPPLFGFLLAANIVFTSDAAGFDCAAYVSTCSGVAGYEAYQNCAATVAVNDATAMACRIQHLALASSDPTTHCPHAAPNAAAPCDTEKLKTFDCAAYASRCSGTSGYDAYQNCASTIAANDANAMACRIHHLGLTASDPTTHCPHSAPNAAAPCNMEKLQTFDCALYASRCSGIAGYEAYQNCASTIAANDANAMACRTHHLGLAASDPTTHCPHSAPNAAAPCNMEKLKTFDCAVYASRCSGIAGYEAYQDCAATIATNDANSMACRIHHLALAASDPTTHCPHSAPNAAAPCNTEKLSAPAFDCAAYASRCSGISGYEAYQNCASTVAANGASAMACRIKHLALAASDPTTHCPHAAPNAAAPCNTEKLKTFDCAAYQSRCNGIAGFQSYENCEGTVADNDANKMACRIHHLALAASASDPKTHCPHCAPNAAAPCDTESIVLARGDISKWFRTSDSKRSFALDGLIVLVFSLGVASANAKFR